MRALAILAATTGCAANLADSLETEGSALATLGASHGVPGEQIEYEMTLAGVTIGRLQIAVGERGMIGGRDAVIVRSHASLAGVGALLGRIDWEITTTIDIASGFALEETEDLVAEAVGRTARHHAKHSWKVAERRHNVHSAAGVLRGWFSAPGARDRIDVHLFDETIPVTIEDVGREPVGTTPAVRYNARIEGEDDVSVWVSDDDARVPLRLRTGSNLGLVAVDLVRYE